MVDHTGEVNTMGKAANQSDLVSFKELLLANSIQIDALTQLLIETGRINEERFFTKLKDVQLQYRDRGNAKKNHIRGSNRG
jgi:hypothetical protein